MTKRIEIKVHGPLVDSLSREIFRVDGRPPSQNFNPSLVYHLVERVNGLSIIIWADEHPPPHFHVKYQGQDASFSILDCSRLPGRSGLERYEWTIRNWWASHRVELAQKWNDLRPADCPVGTIDLPAHPDDET